MISLGGSAEKRTLGILVDILEWTFEKASGEIHKFQEISSKNVQIYYCRIKKKSWKVSNGISELYAGALLWKNFRRNFEKKTVGDPAGTVEGSLKKKSNGIKKVLTKKLLEGLLLEFPVELPKKVFKKFSKKPFFRKFWRDIFEAKKIVQDVLTNSQRNLKKYLGKIH